MAWAEKLPSGRYRGVYRDAGDKRRSAGTFAHKSAALRAANTKESEVRKSMVADPNAYKQTWKTWADKWWPTRSVEPSTLKADRIRRKTHLADRWDDVPLGSITRQDVKAWASDMAAGGAGPATVQRAVHLLSASLNAAVDAEILTANPAARIQLPKGAKAQERFLTREEYTALRDELPTTDDQLVADLLVYTGMRWGEMSGLHWHRVDLKRGIVRVVETWDEPGGMMKAYPKGKKVRDIPLTPGLVKALKERRKSLPAKLTCSVDHVAGRCRSGLVITTEKRASVLRNSNWSPIWRDAVERSKIGHARIYDLRHTYASWLLQAGVPLAEVGRLMGHVSTQTTAGYAHLAELPSAAVLAALAAPRLPHAGPNNKAV
ncbi:tyrosine-type recombinase/integrase [Nocardioides marmoriginsengisoli]|uniref:tyrosine-type recombinase/integrase n=1 Tax=Nocardioides marmoriginsengisoli TaxID=661483 RepID=UPI001613D7D2|nr:site-specific integrase [Nocardioides marmoriginsengisoli]